MKIFNSGEKYDGMKAEDAGWVSLYPKSESYGGLSRVVNIGENNKMKRSVLSLFLVLCMMANLLVNLAPEKTQAAGSSTTTGNLIANPGGELITGDETRLNQNGWTEDTSPERGYSYDAQSMNVTPHGGSKVMGFYCMSNPSIIQSNCYQIISLPNRTAGSSVSYTFSGFMVVSAEGSGTGTAALKIEQLGADDTLLASDLREATQATAGDLTQYTMNGAVTANATKLRVSIAANLNAPDYGASDAFAAFDDLSLTLTTTTPPPLTVTGGTEGTDYTYTGSVLTVISNKALTIANTAGVSTTKDRIEIASSAGANITLAGVNIDVSSSASIAAFKITSAAGAVNLTLADGSVNTFQSGLYADNSNIYCAGLQKESSALLTIQGGGSLTAVGSDYAAGIGSYSNYRTGSGACSQITVSGGTVIAQGGTYAPGIGSGGSNGTIGACSQIIINGGSVNAVGGDYASGIGTGAKTGGEDIGLGQSAVVTNGAGTTVVHYTLTLKDTTSQPVANTPVTSLSVTPALGYTYGMSGVKTDADGKLYVYLPASKTAVSVTAGGNTYTGAVTAGTPNTATLKQLPSVGTLSVSNTLTAGTHYQTSDFESAVPTVSANGYTITAQGWQNATENTGSSTAPTTGWSDWSSGDLILTLTSDYWLRYYVTYQDGQTTTTIYSNPVKLTVAGNQTALALTASPSGPQTVNTEITLTAALTGYFVNAGLSGQKVIFKNGNDTLGSADLDGDGIAALKWTPAQAGTYQITASYAGSSYNTAASAALSCQVLNSLTNVSVVQNGTLTYTGSAQTPAVTTSATAVGGAAVTFTYGTTAGSYGTAIPAFTNAGNYTVYYKASAAEHADVTGSFPVTIGPASQAAPEAGAGYTIDYQKETIAIAGGYEVSTTDFGTTISTGAKLVPGRTYYIRRPADQNHTAGTAAPIVLPARPASGPALTVNTALENVTLPAGYSYQIGGGSSVSVSADTGVPLAPGEVLTYWKTATDSAFAGSSTALTAPARLAKPSAPAVDAAYQTLGTTASMQYRIGNGAWSDCTADMALTQFGWSADTAVVVELRLKATSDHYASESVTVTLASDTTAPTGAIAIGTNSWTGFLNTVTFGLFFRETQTVKVTAADAVSGVAGAEYLLSSTAFTSADLVSGSWNTLTLDSTGSGSFTLNPKSRQFIYLRLTDHAGNRVILNSAGVVIYTDALLSNTTVEFNPDKPADAVVTLTLNGNTLTGIRQGSTQLTAGTDYTCTAEGTLTLSKSFLANALTSDALVLPLSFAPMGVVTDQVSLTSELTVKKHVHTWGAGVMTTAPTIASAGVLTYTCTGCGVTRTETAAMLPAKERTVPDSEVKEEQKAEVTGILADDAKLVVTPIREGTGYNTLISLVDTEENQVIGAYEAKIYGQYMGQLLLTFRIDPKYNGRTAAILHMKKDGTTETFTRTVMDGKVSITVDELSPFMITIEKEAESGGTSNAEKGGATGGSGTRGKTTGGQTTGGQISRPAAKPAANTGSGSTVSKTKTGTAPSDNGKTAAQAGNTAETENTTTENTAETENTTAENAAKTENTEQTGNIASTEGTVSTVQNGTGATTETTVETKKAGPLFWLLVIPAGGVLAFLILLFGKRRKEEKK